MCGLVVVVVEWLVGLDNGAKLTLLLLCSTVQTIQLFNCSALDPSNTAQHCNHCCATHKQHDVGH